MVPKRILYDGLIDPLPERLPLIAGPVALFGVRAERRCRSNS